MKNNMHCTFKNLLILLTIWGCIAVPLHAQQDTRTPIEVVSSVADRTIETVPFAFRTILQKPAKYFRGINTLNFERTFPLDGAGVAYAYSVIDSDREQTMPFEVSHNDGLKVWINGEVVYEKKGNGEAKLNEEERDTFLDNKFEATIQKGENQILVKSETKGEQWKVYIRPRYPKVPEGQPKDDQWMSLDLTKLPYVTQEVADLSNWFMIGPFPNPTKSGSRTGLDTEYPPEKEFTIGRLYSYEGKEIAWQLPKVEILADVIDMHPLWGTLYDWNYHTAGLAWAIRHLGEVTGEQRYIDYMSDYCDFMLDIRPYIAYEKYTLNRPYSRHTHLVGTPLLDFTAAPTLPFLYRVIEDKSFDRREEYVDIVEEMQDYVANEQVRMEDGTFTRETPFKYTTWVDDMFMGIPFLLHSAKFAQTDAERDKWLNDAARQVFGFHKRIYDPEMELYSHAQYSERPDVRLPYWSRANGWGIWATSEVLLHLPKSHPRYKQIRKIFRDHIDGIIAMQNEETGFWHNVLNKRDSFKETSGTAIFTMAIARGINNGWLKRRKYEEYAMKGWGAIKTVVAENGNVTDICMGTMCTEDVDYYYKRPVVEDDSHGLLGLVFAGIEMQQLVEGKK